jgi:hypothetical protein
MPSPDYLGEELIGVVPRVACGVMWRRGIDAVIAVCLPKHTNEHWDSRPHRELRPTGFPAPFLHTPPAPARSRFVRASFELVRGLLEATLILAPCPRKPDPRSIGRCVPHTAQ